MCILVCSALSYISIPSVFVTKQQHVPLTLLAVRTSILTTIGLSGSLLHRDTGRKALTHFYWLKAPQEGQLIRPRIDDLILLHETLPWV